MVSVVRSLSLLVLVCLVLDIMSLFSLVVQVFILVAFLVAGVLFCEQKDYAKHAIIGRRRRTVFN